TTAGYDAGRLTGRRSGARERPLLLIRDKFSPELPPPASAHGYGRHSAGRSSSFRRADSCALQRVSRLGGRERRQYRHVEVADDFIRRAERRVEEVCGKNGASAYQAGKHK